MLRKALPRRDEDEGFAEDHADVALEHQPPPTEAIPLALLKAALEELDLACEGGDGGGGGSVNKLVEVEATTVPAELSDDIQGAGEATNAAATTPAATTPPTAPPASANGAAATATASASANASANASAAPTSSDASHYASAHRYRGLALLGLLRDLEAAQALEASLAWSRCDVAHSGSSSSSSASVSGSNSTSGSTSSGASNPARAAADLPGSGETEKGGPMPPPLPSPAVPAATTALTTPVGHVGAWLALAAAYARQQQSAQSVACLRAAAAQHAPASDPPAWQALLATPSHDPRRR